MKRKQLLTMLLSFVIVFGQTTTYAFDEDMNIMTDSSYESVIWDEGDYEVDLDWEEGAEEIIISEEDMDLLIHEAESEEEEDIFIEPEDSETSEELDDILDQISADAFIPDNGSGIDTDNNDDVFNTWWDSPEYSFLVQNDDKSFTRIEYCQKYYTHEKIVLVEQYSTDMKLIKRLEITPELSLFGGFYAGITHYYLLYGQNNPTQNDSCEVLRLVKYNKNWTRVGSCSIYGENTTVPFDAGTADFTEAKGKLYIHTCHEMYASSDGYNHQANMTFVIDESTMKVVDKYSDVMNISYGYVSHSFSQKIASDENDIYRVDLGDAYPRSLVLTKTSVDDKITKVNWLNLFEIQGKVGDNYTGVVLGDLQLSASNCLVTGSSINQSSLDTFYKSEQQNVFLVVAPKTLTSKKIIWLTNYSESASIDISKVRLVKMSDNSYFILWMEKINDTSETCIVEVNANGNIINNINRINADLTACEPVVSSDGKINWYQTSGSNDVVIYQMNPNNIQNDISTFQVSLSNTSYMYDGKEKRPTVTVKKGTLVLKEGIDYRITYANNTNAIDNALVVLDGIGKYTGTTVRTFSIKPINLSDASVTLGKTCDASTQKPIKPSVTVKLHNKKLVENVDFFIQYLTLDDENLAWIIGLDNYWGDTYVYYEDHDCPEYVTKTKATCISQGLKTTTCQNCKKVIQIKTNIDPDNHIYKSTSAVKNNSISVKCDGCGIFQKLGLVKDYDLLFQNETGTSYSSFYPDILPKGKSREIWLDSNSFGKGDTIYDEYEVKSSNPEIISVKQLEDYFYNIYRLDAIGEGTATITVYPKFRPDLKQTVKITTGLGTTSIKSITNKNDGITLTWDQIKNADGYYIYRKEGNGSYKKIKTVASSGKSSYSYTDKSVKSSNGKTYTYSVRAYRDNLTSKYKASTIIRLNAPEVTSCVGTPSKAITLKWKKASSATGYQINYKLDSTSKTITVSKLSTVKYVIKKLKKNKTYSVKMRTYKKSNGDTFYSAWSKTYKTKVK